MKITLTVDRLTGNRVEWSLNIDRGMSAREGERMAAESEHRYRMGLEAVAVASASDAQAIATEALNG